MKNFSFENITDHIANTIVDKRKWIERIFIILTLICLVLYPLVGVNYNLSSYLPKFAETKQALDVMENEFGYPGMARIMVKNITLSQAKHIDRAISDVDGVSMVLGPDSVTDVYMADFLTKNDLTDEFYKEGNACFQVVFDGEDSDTSTKEALNKIYKITGDKAYYTGSAVSSKERQEAITHEIKIAIGIAVVIIFLILTLTTTSWFEPVLFILIMAVAIILNLGSNIVVGTISFFTFSTAAILQLAVSIDYSIFLLHTFQDYRRTGLPIEEAMKLAVKCPSIFSSGAATMAAFIAMTFMKYTIGKDIGFVLTKGVLCSLFTVIFLMPSLILRFDKLIEKTTHRPFLPSFDKFGRAMYRLRIPVLIITILLAVPSFVGQSMNKYYYGDEAMGAGPGTRYYEDTQEINKIFGKSNMVIAMVPNGSVVNERKLTDDLDNLDCTNYAISLSSLLPESVPENFVPHQVLSKLRSKNYARILVSMDTVEESNYAFSCTDKLTKIIKSYYPKHSYIIGTTPVTMDSKKILISDSNRVDLLSVIGIAIVVALTFRSFLIPILVIVPIEIAIFINMAMPYIMGDSMIFMGRIIVTCIQLGATVDYSILMTNNYMDLRKQQLPPEKAAVAAISKSTLAIITSGFILTVVGYLLYYTSSLQSISQIGNLVGRGALLSMIMVLSLLPASLCTFDKTIHYKRGKGKKQNKKPVPLDSKKEEKEKAEIPTV